MMKTLIVILLLALCHTAHAGGNVAVIGVEGPTRPPSDNSFAVEAQEYWSRYPDVQRDAYYGSSPEKAWEHFQCCGRFEGRTWKSISSIAILSYCGDIGVGGSGHGYNCIHFPDGARIGGLSWESNVKVNNSEVLSHLRTSNGIVLLTTYQKGVSRADKNLTFPDPIDLPPGTFVWIYAEGWGDSNAGGYEVQLSLYLIGNARWTQ